MIGLALALALAPMPEQPPNGYRLAEVLAAPPAGDRWRFPPVAEVNRWAWFSYRYRQNLLARADQEEPDRRHLFISAHSAMRPNWWAWELLWQIDQNHDQEWQKRLKLAQLRALIGEDDYYAGVLPEAVPGWLFHDLSR